MANKATIKLAIQLDEEEARKLAARTKEIVESTNKVIADANKKAATEHGGDTVWAETQKQVGIADEKLNQYLNTARKAGVEQQFLTTLITKGEQAAINELNKKLGLQTKSNALTKEEIQLIQLRATELRHESIAIRRAAADLRLFSEAALITGTAIVAGMSLMAKQFADANKEGDVQAAKYTAQLDRVKLSQNEIGRQFSIALMPFLEQTIKVLDRASKFLSEHPEVGQAAIKGAEILVGVGLVGKSVATAARLTADFLAIQSSIMRLIATRAEEALKADKEIAAAELQKVAADEQLEAAGIQAETAGAQTAAKATGAFTAGGALAGVGAAITSPAGIGALIVGNVLIAKKISDQTEQLQGILNTIHGGLGDGFKQVVTSFFQIIPGGQFVTLVEQAKYISKAVQGIFGKVVEQPGPGRTATTPAGRTDILNIPVGSVAQSKHLDDMLAAYQKYMDEDLKLVQDHYAKRQSIIDAALKDVEKENDRYAKTVSKINKDLGDKLSGYTKDYNRQAEKDERDWQEKRANVIRDANDDVLRIEEDLRDKLAKLAKDHAERQGDLLAARDALGLVKEQRRYQRETDEATAEANKEIARRRKDIAQKLADIDREYAEERQRRLEDYQERVLEAKQEAADKMKEEQERHTEELKQIAREEAEKLADEAKNFATERKKNYDQFITRLRDLDAFYLGEVNRQRQAHQAMIADLDAFLTAYRNKNIATYNAINAATSKPTATTGTVGHRAGGGYVGAQTYKVGEQGYEFVMNHQTTQAAEQAVGGQLSQQNILAAMGKKTTIVWNDQRRFDGRITDAERRAITQDTIAVIERQME